jgi:hypothetical protein
VGFSQEPVKPGSESDFAPATRIVHELLPLNFHLRARDLCRLLWGHSSADHHSALKAGSSSSPLMSERDLCSGGDRRGARPGGKATQLFGWRRTAADHCQRPKAPMACSFSRTQKRLENKTKPIAAMAKTDSGLGAGRRRLSGQRRQRINACSGPPLKDRVAAKRVRTEKLLCVGLFCKWLSRMSRRRRQHSLQVVDQAAGGEQRPDACSRRIGFPAFNAGRRASFCLPAR